MARVKLPAGIESISGKVGNVCFRTMKATGKVYMAHLPQKRRTKLKASELEAREVFKKRAQLVRQMQKAGSRLSAKKLWAIVAEAV